MCWACEQDRFWAAYAEYMAAKEAQSLNGAPRAEPAAEPSDEHSTSSEPVHD